MRLGKKNRMKDEEPQEIDQQKAVQDQPEECQEETGLIQQDKEPEEAGSYQPDKNLEGADWNQPDKNLEGAGWNQSDKNLGTAGSEQPDECLKKGKSKKQSGKKGNDQDIENLLKMEKMKHGRNRARIIAFVAILIATAAILIAVGIYRADYSKVITVISTVGDVTFTDKSRDGDGCYVTLTAADYNRIPEEWQSGIRIKIDSGLYDILVLNMEYDTANIVFEVPQGIARKAGFSQEEMNIKSLWTDEILSQYTSVRNIIWSTEY